jgi:hypothetical protein
MGATISLADLEGMKHNGYDPAARMEDQNDSRPHGPQYAVALQELRTAIAEAEGRVDHLMVVRRRQLIGIERPGWCYAARMVAEPPAGEHCSQRGVEPYS